MRADFLKLSDGAEAILEVRRSNRNLATGIYPRMRIMSDVIWVVIWVQASERPNLTGGCRCGIIHLWDPRNVPSLKRALLRSCLTKLIEIIKV